MNPKRIVLALTVLGLLAAPVAFGATTRPYKQGGTYAGTTKQGTVCRVVDEQTDQPRDDGQCRISLKVGGTVPNPRVTAVTVSFRAGPCSDSPDRYYRSTVNLEGGSTRPQLGLISRESGTFAKRDNVTQVLRNDDGTISGQSRNAVTVNGKFKRSKSGKYSVSGTFTVVADQRASGGARSKCETGTVKYKAKLQK
jgi:hypothetical protein